MAANDPEAKESEGIQIKILIVDDEPQMVELLTRFLEPIASEIESTDDLSSAMEAARARSFDVVVLDLRLKTTGKEEAFMAIRELKRNGAVVVVVSGLQDPNLKDESMAAGAASFVPKDGSFGARAMMIATNIATLKLPAGTRSDNYLQRVEMLHKMVTTP